MIGAWFATGPFLAAGAAHPEQRLMGGLSPGAVGGVFLLVGAVFTAGAVVWGFVMPRAGRRATMLWSTSALGAASLLLWQWNRAEPPPWLVPDGLVGGLVLGTVFVASGFTPAALAYLAEIAERHASDRGAVMGVYSVLLSVGHLVGGALAAPFVGSWGMNGLIVLTGLLCLVGMFSIYLLDHRPRPLSLWHYAQAAAATVSAFLLAVGTYPLSPGGWPIWLLLAVLASAAYGGVRPALLATAMSGVAIMYILPPFGALDIPSGHDAAALTAFLLTALLGSLLVAGLRRRPEHSSIDVATPG